MLKKQTIKFNSDLNSVESSSSENKDNESLNLEQLQNDVLGKGKIGEERLDDTKSLSESDISSEFDSDGTKIKPIK